MVWLVRGPLVAYIDTVYVVLGSRLVSWYSWLSPSTRIVSPATVRKKG